MRREKLNDNVLKKGDTIKCLDKWDMEYYCRALREAGIEYTTDDETFIITIA